MRKITQLLEIMEILKRHRVKEVFRIEEYSENCYEFDGQSIYVSEDVNLNFVFEKEMLESLKIVQVGFEWDSLLFYITVNRISI